jgi:cation transport regulator ChaC
MPQTVWYFAYGSNMSSAQVRSRAGEILEEKVARLDNYEVVFNKKARGGTATANIRPAQGKTVYGVLYRLTEAGLRALDRFEGVPEHYRRIEVTVVDEEGRRIPAQTYIATRVEKGLKPANHYLQIILQGAEEHKLPAEYIETLKQAADCG